MNDAIRKIERLHEEGEKFTFANFSTKSQYGNAASLAPNWVTWTTRVEGAVSSLFGRESAQSALVKKANSIHLIGNGQDKFQQAKSYYMGALSTALETLKEDTFNEIDTRAIGGSTALPSFAVSKDDEGLSDEIFVVHGHDDVARLEVSTLIAKAGLKPIVLHEQPSKGQTVIEKLEHHSTVSFAAVILTPDDMGGPKTGEMRPRARQNVIAELFYFIGKLGRSRVCALVKDSIEIPSDIGGVVYVPMDPHGGWKTALLRELEAAGHKIDWGKSLR